MMDRRAFLSATALYLFAGKAPAETLQSFAEAAFADIEDGLGGRVGVMAIDSANGAELGHRPDERFAMCSTFKWVLAAAVLDAVDRDDMSLDEHLPFSEEDLLDYAPVAKEHVASGALSIGKLCEASVTVSDNTAANLLLARIGGPAGLTAFLRQSGDRITRLDRMEPALNSNIAGDARDTTTPRAMAETMQRILVGNVLSAASRERLLDWLRATATGLKRLRAGLPADWTAGDKTGTGTRGAANDVAIAWPPARPPILIAAYLSGSPAPPHALDTAHARIATIVARQLS